MIWSAWTWVAGADSMFHVEHDANFGIYGGRQRGALSMIALHRSKNSGRNVPRGTLSGESQNIRGSSVGSPSARLRMILVTPVFHMEHFTLWTSTRFSDPECSTWNTFQLEMNSQAQSSAFKLVGSSLVFHQEHSAWHPAIAS